MNTSTPIGASGAGFGPGAMPFKDMPQAAAEPSFEVRDAVVYLKGSRSRSSGSQAFPAREVCLETGRRDMEPMTFGPRGVLYTYSTVHVSATRATPYTLGYVDFDNGVRVLCHVEHAGQALACDQAVELRAQDARWFVVPTLNEQGENA